MMIAKRSSCLCVVDLHKKHWVLCEAQGMHDESDSLLDLEKQRAPH